MKEKCLETRKIYSGRVVALRIDRVMLPSGRKSIREVVEHRGAVAAIPVKGDKIILIRQYRYPVDEVIYEIPAGTREKNETPDETMARELEEEIGYRAGRLTHLFTFYSTPGFTTEKISIYLAEELE
ncbi:ADP-ribose pyrophosphatase, partial [bacterium]